MKAAVAIILVLLLISCQRNPAPQLVKEYQMSGEVVSMDAKSQTATVKHGKIDGWMEAMTMEYPVKNKQEFDKLKVGEKIQAKILVQGMDYWIAAASAEK